MQVLITVSKQCQDGTAVPSWHCLETSIEKNVDAYSFLAVLLILLDLGEKNDHNRVHKYPLQDCIQAELYSVKSFIYSVLTTFHLRLFLYSGLLPLDFKTKMLCSIRNFSLL